MLHERLAAEAHQVVAEIDQEARDPVSFAGGVLDPYRHVCAFVASREEMQRIFDPFVLEGLERGDSVSWLVGPGDRAGWVRHFRRVGVDLPSLHAEGRFAVRAWLEPDRRGSRFDTEAMLQLLDALLGGSRSPRIRLVSEMGWVGDQHATRDLLEFEARANYLMPDHDHIAICVYDTTQFGGDVMIDILRTHPLALIGGVLQVNPFFVPPAEFLAELRSRDRLASDG